MTITHKPVLQARPSVTTATDNVYAPGAGVEFTVKTICVCNTSASTAKYSIYHNIADAVFDEDSALFYQVDLAAKATIWLEVFIAMNSSGEFSVQTDTADALTFTVYGAEFS